MSDKLVHFKLIPYVQAADFPPKVEEYCIENEISIHYQNDVRYIEDDGNPFAEWLKKNNISKEADGEGWTVAISAT